MNQPQSKAPYSDIGYLKARVFTANGAIPLEGVSVKISSAEDESRSVAFDLLTNRNGETAIVEVPAPSLSLSTSPGSLHPYAVYNMEAYLDGYYPFQAQALPVFSGVLSVQPIGLIPTSEYNKSESEPDTPGKIIGPTPYPVEPGNGVPPQMLDE
jgi:hypothetical protein